MSTHRKNCSVMATLISWRIIFHHNLLIHATASWHPKKEQEDFFCVLFYLRTFSNIPRYGDLESCHNKDLKRHMLEASSPETLHFTWNKDWFYISILPFLFSNFLQVHEKIVAYSIELQSWLAGNITRSCFTIFFHVCFMFLRSQHTFWMTVHLLKSKIKSV